MKYTGKSIIWAALIIASALIAAASPMDSKLLVFLFTMLPVIGWAAFGRPHECTACPPTHDGDQP